MVECLWAFLNTQIYTILFWTELCSSGRQAWCGRTGSSPNQEKLWVRVSQLSAPPGCLSLRSSPGEVHGHGAEQLTHCQSQVSCGLMVNSQLSDHLRCSPVRDMPSSGLVCLCVTLCVCVCVCVCVCMCVCVCVRVYLWTHNNEFPLVGW